MITFIRLSKGNECLMHGQGRHILLSVDTCAACPQDMLLLRNVKLRDCTPNCTSML